MVILRDSNRNFFDTSRNSYTLTRDFSVNVAYLSYKNHHRPIYPNLRQTINSSDLLISRPLFQRNHQTCHFATTQEKPLLVTSPLRRVWYILSRGILISYALLALIPLTTLLMAIYHFFAGNRERTRGCLFYTWTGVLSLPLSFLMLISTPYVWLTDWQDRKILESIQRFWMQTTVRPFVSIEVIGKENLSSVSREALDNKGILYVSNHQSWMDIYSLSFVGIPLKFISKKEIFWIPCVGWCMYLVGHVPLDRSTKNSRTNVLNVCKERLKNAGSVFFFAEGTRSRDGKLRKFKNGAFQLAVDSKSPILPLTITGSGEVMPAGQETYLDKGLIRIFIHPPIYPSTYQNSNDPVKDINSYCKQVISQPLMIDDVKAATDVITKEMKQGWTLPNDQIDLDLSDKFDMSNDLYQIVDKIKKGFQTPSKFYVKLGDIGKYYKLEVIKNDWKRAGALKNSEEVF